jgi:hypothetical protein
MSQTAPAAGDVSAAGAPPPVRWSSGAGIRWRVLASLLGTLAWLIFTLLYVGFWAHGFSLFQSVIVILVSLLILLGVLGSTWMVWGTHASGWRHAERWDERWEPKRPRNSG